MQMWVILLFLHLWGNVDVSLSQNACSTLPEVPHALLSESRKAEYQEGDVIHFTCEPGYTSIQTSKYVCMRSGWLRVRQGACYSCSTLPDVPHAFVSEETKKANYQEGDMIHFTCEAGYTSGQTIKYVCMSDGWLAVHQETCSSNMYCEVGVMHPYLYVAGLPPRNEVMKTGHKLRFHCSEQYVLDGREETECLENGQWNSPFPTCARKCKVSGVPDNVYVTTSIQNNELIRGQKIEFACRQHGQVLRGSAAVECISDGQWSNPFPTCGAPVGCGRPPPLADGDSKLSVRLYYRHNEQVEYVCQNYYVMEGEPFKTCKNGEWIGEMRCLKPCTVNREIMRAHNIDFRFRADDKLYSHHNQEMEFRCVGRTRHDGIVALRQACVDGVVHLPTCH